MKKNKKRNSLTTALAVYEASRQTEEMTYEEYTKACSRISCEPDSWKPEFCRAHRIAVRLYKVYDAAYAARFAAEQALLEAVMRDGPPAPTGYRWHLRPAVPGEPPY